MLLGDIGAGQFGKAMNNFLLWVNGIALIEAGRLSEANGMDLVKLREALLISSGASDALKNWENVSFLWALKDMQIVAKMADKAGLCDADRRRDQGTGQGRPAHQAEQSAGLDRQGRQGRSIEASAFVLAMRRHLTAFGDGGRRQRRSFTVTPPHPAPAAPRRAAGLSRNSANDDSLEATAGSRRGRR